MLKYAITGNIASGKSVVENFLKEQGYKVLDTDVVAHCALENNCDVIDIFKDFDILDDGQISRKKLGKIVFDDEVMRKKLENIIHPIVSDKILEFFEKNKDDSKVFIAIPLLFETGMEKFFDKIIFVYTDDSIRLQRLMKRNNLTENEAIMRMQSQQNQNEKVNKSDIVLYNNTTLEDLKNQIMRLVV